jgi:hypothetical protein
VSLEYRTGELLKARFIAHVAEIGQISHGSLVRDILVACGLCLGHDRFYGPIVEERALDPSCFKIARGQFGSAASVLGAAVVSCPTPPRVGACEGGRGFQVRYCAGYCNHGLGRSGVRSVLGSGDYFAFLSIWVAYAMLLLVPWFVGRHLEHASDLGFWTLPLTDGSLNARFTILLFSPWRISRIPSFQ